MRERDQNAVQSFMDAKFPDKNAAIPVTQVQHQEIATALTANPNIESTIATINATRAADKQITTAQYIADTNNFNALNGIIMAMPSGKENALTNAAILR